jgi:hypothetical protein
MATTGEQNDVSARRPTDRVPTVHEEREISLVNGRG